MGYRIPSVFRIGEDVLGGKLNRMNSPVIGGVGQSAIPPATTPLSAVPGQLGMEFELEAPEALAFSDAAIGTLFQGTYQFVRLDPAAPLAAVRGCVAFVSLANAQNGTYTVSTDAATAALLARPCGIFLNVVTQGNYCVIQTGGLASLQFHNDVTQPVDGNLVKIVAGVTTNVNLGVGQQVDADLGTPTALLVAAYIRSGMIAAALPVDNTIGPVWLERRIRLV